MYLCGDMPVKSVMFIHILQIAGAVNFPLQFHIHGMCYANATKIGKRVNIRA